jgi:voltage-gated potassium channel
MGYLYTSSFYFVITTFTSVGYGDIKGNTNQEYLFQLLVELIGMGFFGYLTGSL